MVHFKRWLIVVGAVIALLIGFQTAHAGECSDGDISACWARFYAEGGSPGNESRVYFRIFKSCSDGMRIGIATNMVDDYDFYIKQYANDQSPQWRLLTGITNVALDPVPGGVAIEMTGETATNYGGMETVYFMKIFNVGWSKSFNSNYTSMALASQNYGFSEDDVTGVVRGSVLENCKLFSRPFITPWLAPIAQCYIPGRHNTFTAVFGYYNNTGYDTIIPKGPYNRISLPFPSRAVPQPQPTFFETGVHYNVVSLAGSHYALTWKLGGTSRTVSLLSPQCRKS